MLAINTVLMWIFSITAAPVAAVEELLEGQEGFSLSAGNSNFLDFDYYVAAAAVAALVELLEGQEGFSLSAGTWRRDGWRELDDLRKKLEQLKELRELVRSLGRSGGKGPLRRAPEAVSGWVGGKGR